MVNETLNRVEAQLRDSRMVPAEKKRLLGLLEELKRELQAPAQAQAEDAASVAAFAEVAAREAAREEINPELLEHASAGLEKAAQSFGHKHPGLTRVVNQICDFLSGTGI